MEKRPCCHAINQSDSRSVYIRGDSLVCKPGDLGVAFRKELYHRRQGIGKTGRDYVADQPGLQNRNAECIIDIGEKECWGKGYGREALQLLLDYAFLELNLHRVSLRVFSFNEKAIRLYERLGFKDEGRSRQSLYRDGRWHDICHMGILQEEYVTSKRSVPGS